MTSPTPVPLIPPPAGETSNFIDPPSRAPQIHIAAAVCLPLIVKFSTLRFYSKLTFKTKKTWDDLTFVLGLIAGISYISILVATINTSAYGLHGWDITSESFSGSTVLITVTNLYMYGLFVWLIKLSLFVLYLEIFSTLRWLKYLAVTGIIVTGLFHLTIVVYFIVSCTPRNGSSQAAWLAAEDAARCLRPKKIMAVVVGAGNVLSDFYLILIPLPAVWGLGIPTRKKLEVSAMFLTGLIACMASIASLVFRAKYTESADSTWEVLPAVTLSIVEMTAGIIVGCMPSVAAVYRCFEMRMVFLLSSKYRRRTAKSGGAETEGNPAMRSYIELRHIYNESPDPNINAADDIKDGFCLTTESTKTTDETRMEHQAKSSVPLRDLPQI